MNPYNYYNPPYMQQPQPVQQLPQRAEQRVMSYFVESAEQMSTIMPMPNTIYLGITHDGGKIFQRRMNNDGLVEVKTYTLVTEQTKKTDLQEILERLTKIERTLNTDTKNEPHVIDVTE